METHTVAAAAAIPSSSAPVACVACTRHQCSVSNPVSSSNSMGRRPGLAHAGLHLEQLLRYVDVHRQIGIELAQAERRAAQIFQRHGSQAVKWLPRFAAGLRRLAGHGCVVSASMRFSTARRKLSVSEAKSRLLGFQRLTAEIAGLVQSREECEADAGDRRRIADRLPQRIRGRIGVAVFLAVQIMKLRNRGVAAFEHLHEQLRRQDLQVIGVDAIRQRVHGAAPGQKLSRADNRYSVLPAMALWNAWLCAFGMPGRTMPSMRSAPEGASRPSAGAASTSVMNPSSETVAMTL